MQQKLELMLKQVHELEEKLANLPAESEEKRKAVGDIAATLKKVAAETFLVSTEIVKRQTNATGQAWNDLENWAVMAHAVGTKMSDILDHLPGPSRSIRDGS